MALKETAGVSRTSNATAKPKQEKHQNKRTLLSLSLSLSAKHQCALLFMRPIDLHFPFLYSTSIHPLKGKFQFTATYFCSLCSVQVKKVLCFWSLARQEAWQRIKQNPMRGKFVYKTTNYINYSGLTRSNSWCSFCNKPEGFYLCLSLHDQRFLEKPTRADWITHLNKHPMLSHWLKRTIYRSNTVYKSKVLILIPNRFQ